MPTPSEIEQVFRENGVDVEGLRNAMQSKIDDGSLTKQQAQEYLLNQYNRLTSQKQEQPSTQEEVKTPGVLQGAYQKAVNAFAFGQGSRIAGALNTDIGRSLAMLNPTTAIPAMMFGAKPGAPSLSNIDVSKQAEQYQQGQQEFLQKQQQFQEEHPVAATVGEVGGTLAGLAIPAGAVGGVAKAGVAATKLGRAGKIGQVASRLAGEATAFGTYEGIREGFGEGRADAIEALKGFGKGAALGGALGMLGGAVQAAEPTLVEKAIELGISPSNSKILVQALGIGAEGTTLGAVPAALEGRAPTAKDIETGLAFAAGGRAASEAISAGLGRARRWLTEPSQQELSEMKARAERINRADVKEQETLGNLMAAGRERAALERQYGIAEEARKLKSEAKESELTYETIEKEINPAVDESKKKWDYYYGKLLEDLERGKSSGYSVYKDEDTSGFFRGLADDYEDAVRQHNEHIKLLKEDRLKKLGRVKTQAAKDKIEKEFNQRVSDADKMLENSKKSVINQVKELEQELYGGTDFVDKTINDKRYFTLSNGVRINLEQYNNLNELLNEFPKSEAREIFNKIINDERVLQLADKAIPISDKISRIKKEGQSFWDALKANPKEYNEFAKIAKEQDRLQLEIAKEIIRNKQQPSRPVSIAVQEQPAAKIDKEIPLDTSLISEARKKEMQYLSELKKAEGAKRYDYEEETIDVKISPSEEQIKSYMKDDKNLTREQAVRLATEANKEGALVRKKQPLTFRQRARKAIESIRETFNVTRPLEKAEEDALRVTGEAIPMDKRASVMAAKLQNGGEWQAMSEPVATVLERELKVSPKVAEKYRVYAQAKKNLQFKQQRGEAISAQDLADVKMFENDKGVQAIDREVKKLNQDVLKGLYDSGRIDKATYEKWKANDSYVPSKAVMDYVDENPVISRDLESFTKRYEGTGLVYENSILSSLKQGQALHRFSELNKIKQQFVDSARKIGDATLQTANENYAGGKVNFNRKNQIVVWRDGKPQVWNVSEKVANYFNPKPQEPVGNFAKALSAMMRLYKGGTTATSLGFSYSNIFRDVQGAVFGSKYGGYIGAESIRNSAKELMENTKLAQFFRKEYGGKTILMTEQLPELAKDSVQDAANALAAAEKAFPEGSQRNILARMFTTVAPEYAGKVMNVSSKATKGALKALTYAGQLGEETTRFSVFKSVLEAKAKNQAQLDLWLREPNKIPKNILAEAGNEAREVTLNFNKQMAPWVEKANRYMLPYFKPSILGAMRGFEALTNPEIAPRAWRYIINLGVLQGLINGRMGTKEQLEKYEAVNNEIAGKTFVLQWKDGKIYSLPLSQEFGPLTKLFGLATEKLYRNTPEQAREDIGREALAAAKQEAENLIPVAGYLTNPSNLTIQPFKLPLELSINKDLYSKVPIEPEYLRALPASMRYNQNTSRTLVKLAEVASKLGVEISPLQMQHIVKGTVSSTGKEALALSDNILATLMSTDLRPRQEMQNNPLIRRFMVDMYAPYNQYSLDAREIIDDNKQGYNALEKGKVDIESQRGKKFAEQYYVYDVIKPYADELTKLYKDRKELLEELREWGEYNRVQYETGKWSREKLLSENDRAMREAEGALTYYKDYQRQLEMAIIRDAKEAKQEYKKNPR